MLISSKALPSDIVV